MAGDFGGACFSDHLMLQGQKIAKQSGMAIQRLDDARPGGAFRSPERPIHTLAQHGANGRREIATA